MENIDKIIFEQFKKINNDGINNKKISLSFIDEIVGSLIMVYEKNNENCLKLKDIYNFEEVKDNIEWKIENSLKIPYINNQRIKAIRFNKSNINSIDKYIS